MSKTAYIPTNTFPRYNTAWLCVRKSGMDDEAIMEGSGADVLTIRFMRLAWASMEAKGTPITGNWAKDEPEAMKLMEASQDVAAEG